MSRRAPPARGELRRGWLLWLLALLLAGPVSGAERFAIDGLNTWLRDGDYYFDAHIEYRFSEQAMQALDNGVPLHLEVRLQVQRQDAWFWERPPLDRRLGYVIRFQPLSELFQVTDLARESQQNFATQQAAISALGDLSGTQLIAAERLQPGTDYELRLRAALDIGALPLPLRPLAYLSPAWQLASDWHSWPLQP